MANYKNQFDQFMGGQASTSSFKSEVSSFMGTNTYAPATTTPQPTIAPVAPIATKKPSIISKAKQAVSDVKEYYGYKPKETIIENLKFGLSQAKAKVAKIEAPKIKDPEDDREKTTSFLKSVVEDSPPVVGAKIIKESAKDAKDFLSGITGAWSAEGKRMGGQNFAAQPEAEFNPKNPSQKLGVIAYDLMKFRVTTQAGGQSQVIQMGTQMFSGAIKTSPLLSPKVAFVQDALGKFTSKQFAKFLNRIKPFNLTLEEATKVTTGKATPEQIAKYQKVVEYSEQSGVPMREIIAKSTKMKVKPSTKIYDFIKNSVESIKKILNSSLTKEEQKLLTAEAGKLERIISQGEYTSQELSGKVISNALEKTANGKQLMKLALEAQKTGQNVVVESATKPPVGPEAKPVAQAEVGTGTKKWIIDRISGAGLEDKAKLNKMSKVDLDKLWSKYLKTNKDDLISASRKITIDPVAQGGKYDIKDNTKQYQEIRNFARRNINILNDPVKVKKELIKEFGDDFTITLYRGLNKGDSPSALDSDITSRLGKFWSPNPAHSELFARRGLPQGRGGPVYAVQVKASELLNRTDVKISQGEVHLPDRLQHGAKIVKDFSAKQPPISVKKPSPIAKRYESAEARIKQAIPQAKTSFVESIPYSTTKGQKSLSVDLPSGGSISFDIVPKQGIIIWDASNKLPSGEYAKGSGEVTKVVRTLMALAKEEGMNISIFAATGSGYWKNLGFDTDKYTHPSLTPKDLEKLDLPKQPPISVKKPSPLPSPIKKPVPPQARKGVKEPSRGVVKKGREFKLTYPEVSKLPKTKLEELESKQGGFTQDFRERVKKGKLSPGDVERAFNIKVKPIDIKNLIRNLPELKENPILTFQKDKGLVFESEMHKFTIKPEAIGFDSSKLKSGDIVNLEGFEYKGKVPVLKQKGVPGGYGDPGGYADVKSTEQRLANIKAIEMPEMVRIAREVMGEAPTLKKFRKSLGMFYGKNSGIIKLDPEIFKNPEIAAKVMAHELGHMADYFEDRTLARGNLVGRVASLNKHMKRIFGDLDDKMVRKELKDLTQLWKPFDENAVPASYKSYRYSAVELYADAISVLFNDPVLLQQKAPIFYDKFFKYLDKKPTIKENFFAIQDTLNQGEEAVFKARDEDLERAFGKGEEGFVAKELEKQKRMTSLMYQVQTLFDDKNTPIIKKVRQAQKAGKPIAPKDNPEFALHGFNYTDGKLKNYVNDNLQPAFSKAQEVNNGWVELGKILQLERSVFERGELANPGGYNPDTARKQLEMMEKSLTPEEWKKLQEAKDIFREAVKKSVDRAEKKGFYTPELISQMKMNPAYATFQVIDYLDTYISSKVYQSTGTLKDVANPATSTVMKLISVEKAIERNDVKKLNIKFLKKEFSDEIEPAKTKWNGKSMEVRDPSDPAIGLVITIEGGKPQGYYVDKDIANTLNHTSNDTIRGMARVSRALSQSKFYRPLFTSFNLGFQTFNFVRDFMRYWKNIPDQNIGEAITSFPRAIKRYTQAAPHATKRALNLKDDLIKEMENSKVIGLTYNDMFSSRDIDEHRPQIERVLEKSGITSQKERKKILIPLHWALDAIETTGNFIETLPKVAGYIELKNKMPEAEMAEFIRKNVGSPDFRIGGTATPVSNNIFLFSNAIKEGIKSDLKIGFTKNQSRSGFWWKTVASSFLPKFIMAAVASGYFGKKLKEQMDKASEYDKTNYIIIPLGLDENGKSVYLRTPQDETGRFMGGMLWKMLNLGKKDKSVQDVFDIFSFGAGQIPNLSPAFTGAGALLTYLSGKNPYDRFRGRNVIPDKEFAAGPKYSLPVLMKWLAKNQGWGIFFPTNYNYYNEEMTSLQKTLNKPFLSNILGRWIKVSDYGETEKYRKTIKAVEKERSIRLLGEREKLDAAIKEYKAGDKNLARLERIEEKLVEDILGKSPYKGTDKAKATSTKKKLRIAILRGESDERVNAIISASTNEAKIELLRQIEAEMEGNEYQELIDLLKENKIISKNLIKELNK